MLRSEVIFCLTSIDVLPLFFTHKIFAAMQGLASMVAQAHSQRGGLEIMSVLRINADIPLGVMMRREPKTTAHAST